jgi:hypothetical protein
MEHTRSYWDFYRGLGLGTTIFLTAEAVLFWQLGSLAKTDARRLRSILATFLIAYAALAVNSYAYFFLGPVIAEIFIASCLGLAIATAKSQAAAYAQTAQWVDLKTPAVLFNHQLWSRSSSLPMRTIEAE